MSLSLHTETTYRVSLTWSSAALAEQYRVYRNNSILATLGSETTSYNDDTGVYGKRYLYRITGVDENGVETNRSSGQEIVLNFRRGGRKAEVIEQEVFFVNVKGQEVSADNLMA